MRRPLRLDADLQGRLRDRLAKGWSEEKIRALSTEEILARLAAFGVRTSTDEFVRCAAWEHSAIAVSDTWRQQGHVSAWGFDDDYIWLAACVLWERLVPQRPSFEMIDERMQAGYDALAAHDTARACDIWLGVWADFKLHLTADMGQVRGLDEVFRGTQAVHNWCQDLEQELGNAGVDDPRYLSERVRYAREFVAQFGADDDQLLLGNFLRAEAEALWSLGERAAAEGRFEALTHRYPDFAWGYIGWADCYWLGPSPTPEPKDYVRAETLYRGALARPTLEDRADVLDRLGDLCSERGDAEQAAAWREQANAEASRTRRRPPAPPTLVAPARPVAVRAAAKLGRNEPCWCGSGRKYKRCHLDVDRGRPQSPPAAQEV
jgi:tetratricopeptide (TPR) repeat protein